jgi:hypothetical protein
MNTHLRSFIHFLFALIINLLIPLVLWVVVTIALFKVVCLISPPFLAEYASQGLASLISIGFRFVPSMLCAIPITVMVVTKLLNNLRRLNLVNWMEYRSICIANYFYYKLLFVFSNLPNPSPTISQPSPHPCSLKMVSANAFKELQNVLPKCNPISPQIGYATCRDTTVRSLPLGMSCPPHLNIFN